MADLGVLVDQKLNSDKRVARIIRKANSTMWLLIRNLGFNAPMRTKKLVYKALERSQIEYSSVLWNPHMKSKIEDLERVQRRATNFIVKNPRRPSEYHIMERHV